MSAKTTVLCESATPDQSGRVRNAPSPIAQGHRPTTLKAWSEPSRSELTVQRGRQQPTPESTDSVPQRNESRLLTEGEEEPTEGARPPGPRRTRGSARRRNPPARPARGAATGKLVYEWSQAAHTGHSFMTIAPQQPCRKHFACLVTKALCARTLGTTCDQWAYWHT